MDRRKLIASFDILSQSFKKDDPIATELRTMAYAVSKMGDNELSGRLSEAAEKESMEEKTASELKEGSEYTKFVKKYMKDHPDADIADAAKAWKKKAAEEEVVEEKDAAKKKEEDMDKWGKEATEAVRRALVSDVFDIDMSEKKAGKIKGPGKPDGTGPYSGTDECPMSKEKEAKGDEKAEKMEEKAKELLEKAEKMEKGADEEKKAEKQPEAGEKDYETEPGRQPQEEGDIEEEHKEDDENNDKDAACGKDHDEEKKEAEKIVDTDILSSIDIPATEEFEGIEIGNPMASEDIGDISENEKVMLDQLFRNADLERLNEDDKAKLDQLFK